MTFLLSLFVFTLLLADLFQKNLSLGPGLSVKNAFLYVLMLVLGFRFVLARQRPVELISIPVCFAALISYAAISILLETELANYPEFSPVAAVIALKSRMVDQAIFFLVFFYAVSTAHDTLRVLRALLLGVVLINTLTMLDVIVGGLGIIHAKVSGRLYGAFGDPNETATVMVTFLPALVTEMTAGRRWARAIWAGGVASCVLVLVMTASRGGFLALILSTILGAIWMRRYLSMVLVVRWSVFIVAGAILAAGVLSVQLTQMFSGRMSVTFEAGLTEASSGRDVIWRDALVRMVAAPWSFFTGFGWNAYDSMAFALAPHSEYLRYWFDLGLPGLFLFVLLFVLMIRIVRRALPFADGLVRGHLVASIFSLIALMISVGFVNLFDAWGYLWAYFGLMMRLAMICRQNERAQSTESQREVRPVADRQRPNASWRPAPSSDQGRRARHIGRARDGV